MNPASHLLWLLVNCNWRNKQDGCVWNSLSSACENSSTNSLNYLVLHVDDSQPSSLASTSLQAHVSKRLACHLKLKLSPFSPTWLQGALSSGGPTSEGAQAWTCVISYSFSLSYFLTCTHLYVLPIFLLIISNINSLVDPDIAYLVQIPIVSRVNHGGVSMILPFQGKTYPHFSTRWPAKSTWT